MIMMSMMMMIIMFTMMMMIMIMIMMMMTMKVIMKMRTMIMMIMMITTTMMIMMKIITRSSSSVVAKPFSLQHPPLSLIPYCIDINFEPMMHSKIVFDVEWFNAKGGIIC